MANGINPKTVVTAVRITGRKRALPPLTMISLTSSLDKSALSGRSQLDNSSVNE